MRKIKGGITAPKGFKSSGIRLKDVGLALIYSERRANAAGVFTPNEIKSAPIEVSKKRLRDGLAQAIIANSGSANCCTGEKGIGDAEEMAILAAKELGIKEEDVLVASTGRIGKFLPMRMIRSRIKKLAEMLSYEGGKVPQAIMTTDTYPKEIAVGTGIMGNKGEVIIGGVAKGAGMISPNFATMLSFITTDALISQKVLMKALIDSVDSSFNMITVDGDMSTNDTVLILANGMAENKDIKSKDRNYEKFRDGLNFITSSLAEMIVRDGEGATKLVKVMVKGARREDEAKKLAFVIANSPLVKTAIFGGDPNWGRIMAALGSGGVRIFPKRIDVSLGDVKVVKGGCKADFQKGRAMEALRKKDIEICVNLNMGKEGAQVLTCDLTDEYVRMNARY